MNDFWDTINETYQFKIEGVHYLISEFLRNLRSQHTLPGSTYCAFVDMLDQYDRHKTLTLKQIRYAIINMVVYFDEFDPNNTFNGDNFSGLGTTIVF